MMPIAVASRGERRRVGPHWRRAAVRPDRRLRETEVQDLHVPSPRTLMFAGFKSRWMMPCSCAASSASAICFAIGCLGDRDRRPRAMRSASVGPSTSSMHQAAHAGHVLEAVDCGDVRMVERGEHLRLSLETRQPVGVATNAALDSTLIATSRLSLASRARYTSPIPPSPSFAMTSYRTETGPGDQGQFGGVSIRREASPRVCGAGSDHPAGRWRL